MRIKRALLALLLICILCAGAAESNKPVYRVNGTSLSDMSIEALYDLEDALVQALSDIHRRTVAENAGGEALCTYVINPRTKKFHLPHCYSALQIGEDRQFTVASSSSLLAQGLKPCGQCSPVSQ